MKRQSKSSNEAVEDHQNVCKLILFSPYFGAAVVDVTLITIRKWWANVSISLRQNPLNGWNDKRDDDSRIFTRQWPLLFIQMQCSWVDLNGPESLYERFTMRFSKMIRLIAWQIFSFNISFSDCYDCDSTEEMKILKFIRLLDLIRLNLVVALFLLWGSVSSMRYDF